MRRNLTVLVGLFFWCAAPAQDFLRPLVLNGDASSLAFDPTFAAHPDRKVTYVWNSYQQGRERIYSTMLQGERLSQHKELSPGGSVYSQPIIVSTGVGAGWAFWMKQVERRWQIAGRRMQNGAWDPAVVLSGETEIAFTPAATAHGSRVVLTWEDHSNIPQSIRVRTWDGHEWAAAKPVSQPEVPSYRPALVATEEDQIWISWDSYDGRDYARPHEYAA